MKIVFLLITDFFVFAIYSTSYHAFAQSAKDSLQNNELPHFVIKAERLSSDSRISVDGVLDEPEWQEVFVATDFTQYWPKDGAKSSQKTDVKVLYTDKYIYVGAKMYDSSPDSIMAPLFRRDGGETSDWFSVLIDSYNDNKTAFSFSVNPLGVQKDLMYQNDEDRDELWDAVWEVGTKIMEDGWVAEFRIPLSQLRFSSTKKIQTWGINFLREIARNDEASFWARTPYEEYGLVSWFGELEGVEDLDRPLRLEVLPYASVGLTREPDPENDNPFYETNDVTPKIGGDIKYGLTSDFTLTATINPDFGQVEADPATLNLTAFETYFEERRSFFLEGNDIFKFGETTSENTFSTHKTFYSRRIGKSPSGNAAMTGIYSLFEDLPNETTIAGAAKISGKTESGFSLGFLDAYTLKETGKYLSVDSSKVKFVVEPATNYMVTRMRKDIKGGDIQIGGFLSSVNRDLNGSYLENYLHESAYQLGMDGQYYWANRTWGMSGSFAVSEVNGTKEAMQYTQQSSAHYYNRVDSKELSLDTTKTSLSGYSAEFSIGKYSGTGLHYSFTYSEMSPGYEVNDIGFLERADYRAPHYYLEYLNLNTEKVRFYLVWAYGGYAWNFDGDMIMNFSGTGIYTQFHNLWSIIYQIGTTGAFYNDRIVRGGPIMRRPKDWNTSLQITSNTTKDFYTTLTGSYRADASGEYRTTLSAELNYRPTGFIQLQFSPTYQKEKNTDQYIGFLNVDADPEADYLFSNLGVDYFYVDLRLNWTFTPKLSFQTYLRPLIYSVDFYRYKTFKERKTYKFDDLLYNGEPVDYKLDYNSKTLQGNAVLRWEYKPGSTIYLVWQQTRNENINGNAYFEPLKDTRDIFKIEPTNIFLIKLSYWFGS